jgi:hypothetical protein
MKKRGGGTVRKKNTSGNKVKEEPLGCSGTNNL